MTAGLLGPFDVISPQQFLSQYSDWLYFSLILVFFIAVAGLTLRRHFDQPYVKPLIISVGLMLTVAVFMKRAWLVALFDGWGVVGAILMVVVIAVIPYGLARGFGMPTGKAFYLTYILFYILSWVKFPAFYTGLAEHRLGIVNVALLLLFFYAAYRLVAGTSKPSLSGIKHNSYQDADVPGIQRDMDGESQEGIVLTRKVWPLTKQEIKTVKDMEEILAGIQRLVEHSDNRLGKGERDRAVNLLGRVVNGENILKADLCRVNKLISQISSIDEQELAHKRKRFDEAKGEEKQILRSEIHRQEMKLQADREIKEYEDKLGTGIRALQDAVNEVIALLGHSPYPLDAKPSLIQARAIVKDIGGIISGISRLESKLADLTDEEQRLLKRERGGRR